MSYAHALDKAWADLSAATDSKGLPVSFLSDTYDIDISSRQILSRSCNIPAKDYTAIILLHYLARKISVKTLPGPTGEWIDFTRLEGGEVYYPTFRKRTIDRVVAKFGGSPGELAVSAARFPTRSAAYGEAGVIIYPFEEVGILITLWRGDEEFGPDGNILYDRNIPDIFCTEDVVVLTEIVVHQL